MGTDSGGHSGLPETAIHRGHGMSLYSDLAFRIRSLLVRRGEERALGEEMRDHIERDTNERIRRGVPPGDARRAALLAFGGLENYLEEARDARGTRPLEELLSDVRVAWRGLRRNPAFTLTATGVLAV